MPIATLSVTHETLETEIVFTVEKRYKAGSADNYHKNWHPATTGARHESLQEAHMRASQMNGSVLDVRVVQETIHRKVVLST